VLKRIVVIGLVASAGYYYWHKHDATPIDLGKLAQSVDVGAAEDAYREHRSGSVLTVEGTVERVLGDDTQAPRHQRFLVRLPSGQTVLVAHNIDLAHRVEGLAPGAPVKVHGEYEWNDKGGVLHWTHKDPQGKHEAGWVEVDGKRFD
jgi:hypothetical protein